MPQATCVTPHFALFYRDEERLRQRAGRFIAAALHGGDAAIAVAKPATLQSIRRELQRLGADSTGGVRAHEFRALDAHDTLARICRAGAPDSVAFERVLGDPIRQLAGDGRGVAAYGEMVGVLCDQGRYDDALALEELWNGLLGQTGASLMCGYAAGAFDSEPARGFYRKVCRAHTNAYDDSTGAVASLK